MMNTVCQEVEGGNPQFQHAFYKQVRDILKDEDADKVAQTVLDEKIPLKLLRVTPAAQDGFVMCDYPGNLPHAEMFEEYKGGINAFVHLSLPDEILVDIEETKIICPESGRVYYKDDVISEEHGVRINKFIPDDGHCYDSGSTNFEPGSDPAQFEKDLA